jgi:GT2 family glycosyltransferase
MNVMAGLQRVWTTLRSRPPVERLQIVRRLLVRLRHDGIASTMAWAREATAAWRDPQRYREWCRTHTPDGAELSAMRAAADALGQRPLISIITATYNTAPGWLDAAAESVVAQVYPHWEWSIADDGSTSTATLEALSRLPARDARIRVARAPQNMGVSAASNLALAGARGEFVALLDHDDVLQPHALFRVVERLNRAGHRPDVVYSDEDKLDSAGARTDAYFKPDWSPDLLRSSMYACHLLVIRRELVDAVGGFRSEFDSSQDYDLLLRVIERTARIEHVPEVLYHWRKVASSTALSPSAKPAAHAAGARALQAHLDRQQIRGRILDAGSPGLYRVQYDIVGEPLVSILMPTREGASPALARTLAALDAKTAYRRVEVLLLSRNGDVPAVLPSTLSVRSVRIESPFQFGAWINHGARAARGAHVLVLHDDVEPRDAQWLSSLLELSQQPWIGAVGAKLVDAQGRLQHIGLALGLGRIAGRPFQGEPADALGYYSSANAIRDCTAVSAACLMTRRDVFDGVGGFDAELPGAAAEVDYGLRVNGAGLRVVFTPFSTAIHRGSGALIGAQHEAHLRQRWGTRLDSDPYYNPNLTREFLDHRVG